MWLNVITAVGNLMQGEEHDIVGMEAIIILFYYTCIIL